MNHNEIFTQISLKLDIPLEVTKEAYNSYWRFIKQTIQQLPLKESISQEEFDSLRTNFNIPSIGKLNLTWDRYNRINKHFNRIKELKDNTYD